MRATPLALEREVSVGFVLNSCVDQVRFAGSPSLWFFVHFLAGCQAGWHAKCTHFSITLRGKLSYPCFEPESHSLSTRGPSYSPTPGSAKRLGERNSLSSCQVVWTEQAGWAHGTVLLVWGGAASSELQGIAHPRRPRLFERAPLTEVWPAGAGLGAVYPMGTTPPGVS